MRIQATRHRCEPTLGLVSTRILALTTHVWRSQASGSPVAQCPLHRLLHQNNGAGGSELSSSIAHVRLGHRLVVRCIVARPKPLCMYAAESAERHCCAEILHCTVRVQRVEVSYDYIDFRPFLPPWVSFQPCDLAPEGDGCECIELNCPTDSPDNPASSTLAVRGSTSRASGAKSEQQKRDLMLVCMLLTLLRCRRVL